MSFDFFTLVIAQRDNPKFIAAASILVFLTYQIFNWRSERGRPPLVRYKLPWVGSAIEMGRDPDHLFKKAVAELGPTFRIRAAGLELNYVAAPELITTVYRDPKTFDFVPIRLEMSEKIFGMSKHVLQDITVHGDFYKAHHDHLAPTHIVDLLQRYGGYAHERIHDALNDIHLGSSTTLAPFIRIPAYDAAMYAFYGKTFPSSESYEPFWTFDAGFPLLRTKMPQFFLKKTIDAREKVIKMAEDYATRPHEDCSEFARVMEGIVKMKNWTLRDLGVTMLGDIWAFQSNAVQAAYWIVALQLQRPEGLSDLVQEIDDSRNKWLKNNLDVKDETFSQWVLESSLPLLTSVIHETLRYASSVFPIRLVKEDTMLGGYRMRKGDYLICANRSVHLDGDIHENPTEFVPDRYVKKTKFIKNGRSIVNHSMPFGGGMSMCEGRHFALGELKIFISLLLTNAIIEIDQSSTERPEFDWSHIGMGILPPKGDLQVRVRRRTTQ